MAKPKKANTLRKRQVGRPVTSPETAIVRLPEGTLGRIAAVLRDGEKQADFFREAVDAALSRREARRA